MRAPCILQRISPRWIVGFAIGLACLWASICPAAGQLPPERAALVLYKCLPYNQRWESLETVDITVVASRRSDVDRAVLFGSYLTEIAAQARLRDGKSPAVQTRVQLAAEVGSGEYPDTPPHVIFLLSTENPSDEAALVEIVRVAERLSILVATDDDVIFHKHAALGFLLSQDLRPEVVIDLERTRQQGA